MIDPNLAFQQLLQSGGSATVFPPTSRYYSVETVVMETVEGKGVVYIKRRFVPQPERFELLQEHLVTQGERLDHITALYLGDPEQFWQICDANGTLRPQELEETGRRLRITLPEGIPGASNA